MKLKDIRQKYNGLLQKFIRLFSLSSVAFVLTACYGCPYAEYDVEGYVYDENGNMLENMQVVVRTFDQNGIIQIQSIPTPMVIIVLFIASLPQEVIVWK